MTPHLKFVESHFNFGITKSIDLCNNYKKSIKRKSIHDNTELLRSALVFAVSAFDNLVHQIIRKEILYRISNELNIFGVLVPIEILSMSDQDRLKEIDRYIQNMNGHKSFVDPKKMSEGLRCILHNPWKEIAAVHADNDEVIKKRIRLIYSQRNRIVHESDINPDSISPLKFPIELDDTFGAIEYIESVGAAIIGAVLVYHV